MKRLLLFCMLTGLFSGLYAETRVVTLSEGGAEVEGTLPYCIAAAADGDDITFNFDGELVKLTMDRFDLTGKKITINGINQFNNKRVVIQAMNEGQGFFNISSSGNLELLNLNLTGFSNTVIAAALGTTVTVSNCTFKNNNAGNNNGGVLRLQGEALIEKSVFENNQTSGSYGGGGICIYNAASVVVNNSTFIGNQSTGGGRAGGGAIVIRPTKTDFTNVLITNCTFEGNSAAIAGGAILASVQSGTNYQGNVGIVNSTFTGNQSNGGAVATLFNVAGTINLHLVNSLLAHNFSSDGSVYSDVLLMNEAGSKATTNFYTWNSIYGNVNIVEAAEATVTANYDASTMISYDTPPAIFDAVETTGTLVSGKVTNKGTLPVVAIAESSITVAAGRSTVPAPLATMLTIPTMDQLGNTRPAMPAVGAVEYDVALDVKNPAADTDQITIWNHGKRIFVSGVSTATVEVYTLLGKRIAQSTIAQGEGFDVDAPEGSVLIVKVTSKGTSKAVKLAF